MNITLNQIIELVSQDLNRFSREELESYIKRLCKRTLNLAQEREAIRKQARINKNILLGSNDYLVARATYLEATLQTLVASSRKQWI